MNSRHNLKFNYKINSHLAWKRERERETHISQMYNTNTDNVIINGELHSVHCVEHGIMKYSLNKKMQHCFPNKKH